MFESATVAPMASYLAVISVVVSVAQLVVIISYIVHRGVDIRSVSHYSVPFARLQGLPNDVIGI